MSASQIKPAATQTVTHFRKPKRSFWQIWNMSFGFFGIQFGWGLQMANMSAIYEYLGAHADQIPILWLAAPLTGLLIQPIIGHASDRTWGRLGRRRPYFLTGAILSSLMLVFMPNCSALWMAAGMLWILDASINVSMEPFRAFVADILPEGQRTAGFAMQSLFIGAGAVIASALPYLLTNVFHMQQAAGDTRVVPTTVRLSFYIGAATFLSAVLWTIVTTKEYPPEDLEAFRRAKLQKAGLAANAKEILAAIAEMPDTMRKLGPVQLCTWLGLFCMWLYFPVAVAHNVFGANDPSCLLGRLLRVFVRASRACKAAGPEIHPFDLPVVRWREPDVGSVDSQQVRAFAYHGGCGHCLGEYAVNALRAACRFASVGTNRRLHGHIQLLCGHTRDPGIAVLWVDHDSPVE
jgi:maltose/moltooligosaccharide transporter